MKLTYYDVTQGLQTIHLQLKSIFHKNIKKWCGENRVSLVFDHWTPSRKVKMLAIMANLNLRNKNIQICIFFDAGKGSKF